ncbi:MAG: hypothetical protein OHK0046_46130 [Anaerolineae bacterium]
MATVEGFYALPQPYIRHGRLADRPDAPTARQQAFIDWQEPALYVAGSDMTWQKIGAPAGENLGVGENVFVGVSDGVLQFRAITAATPLLAIQNEQTVDLSINVGSAGGVQAWNANLDAWAALAPSAKANTSHTHAAADIVSGILPIARGGTGASSASGARAELGLLIGTDVQPYSTNLTAWAALATSAKADASHTHAASAIVSGTLATARGGLGADVSSGAAGQVLIRASLDGPFSASDILTVDTGVNVTSGILRLDRVSQPLITWLVGGSTTAILRLVNASNLFAFQDAGSVSRAVIDYTTGAMGLYGITSPAAALDVAHAGSNAFALLIGADLSGSGRTNTTRKFVRIALPHYTNAEEPLLILTADSESTYSRINIGGGSSAGNAATNIRLMTATTTTTTTGSTMIEIDGTNIGFYGVTAVSRRAYSAITGNQRRVSWTTSTISLAELAEVVHAVIADLDRIGIFDLA